LKETTLTRIPRYLQVRKI